MIKKECHKCGKLFLLTSFHTSMTSKDGRRNTCVDCSNRRRREITIEKKNGMYVSKCRKGRLTKEERELRKEIAKIYGKKYRVIHKDKLKAQKRVWWDNFKLEGIKHYGGKCTCSCGCNVTLVEWLTLEHKNGRNKNEKKFTGKKMWAKAKKEGYPNKYTILCYNCNSGKGNDPLKQCPMITAREFNIVNKRGSVGKIRKVFIQGVNYDTK
jgi:hypothetical protein